jgi:hypothetical protein
MMTQKIYRDIKDSASRLMWLVSNEMKQESAACASQALCYGDSWGRYRFYAQLMAWLGGIACDDWESQQGLADICEELNQMPFIAWYGNVSLLVVPWEAFCLQIAEAAGRPLDLGLETSPEIARIDRTEYDKLGVVLGLAPISGVSSYAE